MGGGNWFGTRRSDGGMGFVVVCRSISGCKSREVPRLQDDLKPWDDQILYGS